MGPVIALMTLAAAVATPALERATAQTGRSATPRAAKMAVAAEPTSSSTPISHLFGRLVAMGGNVSVWLSPAN